MEPTQDILLYQSADGHAQLEVQLQNETLWLTQAQMAELFDKDSDTIGLHIRNIFRTDELKATQLPRNTR